MGIPVLVMGESGSGKSASLRNFSPEEIGVLNVASKPLPFRRKLPVINHAGYSTIITTLRNKSRKVYAIDDSQYLMAFDQFSRAKETGYGKFTDMALNFYNLIKFIIDEMPDDTIVYLLHHTETPIKEIAALCGFNGSNYFCRKFREMFKISPQKFRLQRQTAGLSHNG